MTRGDNPATELSPLAREQAFRTGILHGRIQKRFTQVFKGQWSASVGGFLCAEIPVEKVDGTIPHRTQCFETVDSAHNSRFCTGICLMLVNLCMHKTKVTSPQVHQQLEAPHSLDSAMPSVLLPQPEVDLRSPGVQHPCRHHCIPMHGFLLHCGLVQLDHLRSLGRSSGLDLEGTNHRRDKSKFGGSSSEHHRFCNGRVKIRTWIEGNAYVATNHYLIDEAVLQ